MSLPVREWLPAEARGVGDAVAPAVVRVAISSWASKWFGRGEVEISSRAVRPGRAGPGATGWRSRGAVGTSLSAPATLRLAGLALDAVPERMVLAEADRDIIGRLTAEIAADLAGAIERALGLDPPTVERPSRDGDPLREDGGLELGILDGAGQLLLEIAIPAASLVPRRKASLELPRRDRLPLTGVAAAIDSTAVRVGARLGTASLSLGELATLGPGDVLVLDRPIEDGASLSLLPGGRPFARASIASDDDGFALLLLPQAKD